MKRARWILVPLALAVLAGLGTRYAARAYVLDQASKNIRDVLLSHRGVHLYIQRVMHPEYYQAMTRGKISERYYAPEILSSSFMVRVLHGYYNQEREKVGLPPVYYKLAAENPRNPVNRADPDEERILEYFRQNPAVKEYREVERIQGKEYLVVALPFLRTEKPCLVCHGKRADAPAGLQARYPGNGGFEEHEGELRAIESLRVPIRGGDSAVVVTSLGALVGFGAIGFLFFFNRSLNEAVRHKTAELSSKEITFRRLLDAADAVPFEYLPSEDRFTFVGKQFERLFGVPPSSLRTSSDWKEMVHPDDRETKFQACLHATARGEDYGCQLRVVRPDGASLVVFQTMNIVREEGKPHLAVGFIHDVTAVTRDDALQRARLAIAREAVGTPLNGLIRVIIDTAEDLTESEIGFLHFVSEDQKAQAIQQWSTRTEQICSARGKGQRHPLDDAGAWADCLRTGRAVVHNDCASLPQQRDLPEGHVELTSELVVPITYADKVVAVLGVGNKKVPYGTSDVATLQQLADFAVEIILRKRAEEENARIQEQLVQAQKVEAIGRLAGGVAHDFNNMLSVILGNVDLALQEAPFGSTLHGELAEIQKAADRSAGITKQLLGFARKQISSPKAVDLNDAVDGMLKMLRRLIGEDIDLVWRPQSGLRVVYIDPAQVDQILANLAANARDAIEGVGKVTIETRNVDFDEDYCLTHPEFLPGRYVLLGVTDSGRGIAREDLDRVFEPFFTTKELGRGTGLGLSTVLGIVRQDGGFINVYSEPGQGTTFKIYLPEHAAGSEASEPETRPAGTALRGTETVLIVEDEPSILQLAVRVLGHYGYTVLGAQTPEEALGVASAFAGTIDLLVTDVVMPRMNGKELAALLSSSRPGMRCLYMSGYTANVIVHRGILDDGINFVPKPFSASQLVAKVREVLDS